MPVAAQAKNRATWSAELPVSVTIRSPGAYPAARRASANRSMRAASRP